MSDIQNIIEEAFERRAEINPSNADSDVRNAVNEALAMLDNGSARVAEKQNGDWVVNQWLKKAVLLSFRLNDTIQWLVAKPSTSIKSNPNSPTSPKPISIRPVYALFRLPLCVVVPTSRRAWY